MINVDSLQAFAAIRYYTISALHESIECYCIMWCRVHKPYPWSVLPKDNMRIYLQFFIDISFVEVGNYN